MSVAGNRHRLLVLAGLVATIGVATILLAQVAHTAFWAAGPDSASQDLGRVSSLETQVSSLAVGDDGRVYVGTTDYGKLVIYDPSAGRFVSKGQACPGGTIIYALAKAPDGTIFGGTNNNAFLFSYSPRADAFALPGQVIGGEEELRVLLPVVGGAVFGGTGPNAHVFKLDPKAGPRPIDLGQPAPGETTVFGLVEGGDGSIYGGTSPNGYVFALNPTDGTMQVLGMAGSGINAMAGVGGTMYIGTSSGSLLAYSPQFGIVELGAPVPGERAITTLAKGRDGSIYGGTYPGGYVFRFDIVSRRVTGAWRAVAGESSVAALAVGSDGSIYAGTGPEGHLVKISPAPPAPTPTATATPTPVDAIPPSSTAALDGPAGLNGWFLGNVLVSLSAQDDRSGIAALSFSLDGADWQPYFKPFTISTEGSHSLSFYATDNAGNVEPINRMLVNIDKSVPQIVVNNPSKPDYLHSESLYLDFYVQDSISGPAQATATLDGIAADNGQYVDLFQYSVPSTHTLAISATDYAGNVASKTVSFDVVANIQSTVSDVDRLLASGDITDQSFANSLVEKLSKAQTAIDEGNYTSARNILEAAKSSLEAQRGKAVSEKAHRVLTQDVDYVISTLPLSAVLATRDAARARLQGGSR